MKGLRFALSVGHIEQSRDAHIEQSRDGHIEQSRDVEGMKIEAKIGWAHFSSLRLYSGQAFIPGLTSNYKGLLNLNDANNHLPLGSSEKIVIPNCVTSDA